jgi:hypothetical protein
MDTLHSHRRVFQGQIDSSDSTYVSLVVGDFDKDQSQLLATPKSILRFQKAVFWFTDMIMQFSKLESTKWPLTQILDHGVPQTLL